MHNSSYNQQPIIKSEKTLNSPVFDKIPRPLDTLNGAQIPPFLSKTYDLVQDPNLDPIISWTSRAESFVVWDPLEFAGLVLPRYFKHCNFSSFVRQLNTYFYKGFRKIDLDKWEFANEGFVRGHRYLLKNIHRRKSTQSQQHSLFSSSTYSDQSEIGGEIENLRKEKSALLQEVVELQQQQSGTDQRVESVKIRLQASEQRQKQMLSSLAKLILNPAFVECLKETKEQKALVSPRKKKFLKQNQKEPGSSFGTRQMVRYKPDLDTSGDFPSYGTAPFQAEDVALDELVAEQELMATLEPVENPILKCNDAIPLEPEASNTDCFVIPPGDRTFPEFSSGIGSMIKQEEDWSMGFDIGNDVSTSSPALWGNIMNYGLPDVGTSSPSEFSDMDFGSLQAASTGVENWLLHDSDDVQCP